MALLPSHFPALSIFVETAERSAYTGRDPRTGDPLQIHAAKVVKFTAGKAFKERVNMDTGKKKGKAKGKTKK